MSTLQQLLNSQDAALGPWVPGRDPLEDALSAFAGAPGGPPSHPWMAGLVAGPASNPGLSLCHSQGADRISGRPAFGANERCKPVLCECFKLVCWRAPVSNRTALRHGLIMKAVMYHAPRLPQPAADSRLCTAAEHLGIKLSDPPYPQPVSLSTALLSAQLLVLGSMLASMSESNQLSILNVRFVSAVTRRSCWRTFGLAQGADFISTLTSIGPRGAWCTAS